MLDSQLVHLGARFHSGERIMKEGKQSGLTNKTKKYFNKDRLECQICGESYEQQGWHIQVKLDILPSLKEEDSYGVQASA